MKRAIEFKSQITFIIILTLIINVFMIVFGGTCSQTHSLYVFTDLFEHMEDVISSFYDDFESLEDVEKLSYVLGSELWESKFNRLLSLVKEYIIYIWKI